MGSLRQLKGKLASMIHPNQVSKSSRSKSHVRPFALLSLALAMPGFLSARIPAGVGSALQLFSYRLSSPANKPVINGTILSKQLPWNGSDASSPDEWKEAYSRNITLKSNKAGDTTTTVGTIFLLNDDDSLYVALIRPDQNNGNNMGTFLYFDQGVGGGGGDNRLTGGSSTVRNEAGYGVVRTSGVFVSQDLSWTGTQWAADTDNATDFKGAGNFLGSSPKVQAYEFAIPLRNNKGFSSGNADLQVTSLQQHLGMFIRVSRGGADCDSCYWDKTNANSADPGTGAGWADLALNITHNFTTFYGSYARNGNPTVDGNLSEDAWRGSYRRDIFLTNFNGKVIPATLYSVQDPVAKNLYIGLKVQDNVNNASDSVQVYFEEKAGDNTSARDYVLESGAEDATSAKDGAAANDLNWGGSAWTNDGEAADSHASAGTFASGSHQYEMRIPYQAGAQDIGVPDIGVPGFLIRYHDPDQPAGSQEFYWEFAANSDAVTVNLQTTPNVYITAGWANFQLGAPYTQVIFPTDSAVVEGTVNLRLYAEDQTGVAGIDSVKFYRAADTSSKTKLTRIATTGEWSGAWNVGNLQNGNDTLVFRTYDNNGISVDRLVPLSIANGGLSAAPPSIALSSPMPGSILSGTEAFQFTASGGGGSIRKTYIVVDGADTVATTSASVDSLRTTALRDGNHTVKLLVYNTNGAMAETQLFTFFVENSPVVAWVSPAGGATIGGRLILDYTAQSPAGTALAAESLWVDGRAFARLKAPNGPDTVAIGSLNDGPHLFQIKVTDNNGKQAVSGEIALLAANGPWVTLTSPQGKQAVSGKAVLAYHDSVAAPSTLASDSLLVDGKTYMALSLSGTDSLNSTVLADGEHTLQVKATDSRGKSAYSLTVTVTVRNGPRADIDSAWADSTVSGTSVIRFRTAAVAPATVVSRRISIDGGAFRTTGSDSTDTLDTRRLSDGAHLVQVKVADSQGKEGLSRLVKFNVRNAPTVLFGSPIANAYVSGTITVRFTASVVAPDTLANRQISIGGGDWLKTTTDSTFTLDTKTYKDGDLLLQVRVADASGKADTTLALEIVVDNSPPKVSFPLVAYGKGGKGSQGRLGSTLTVTAQGLDLRAGMNKDSAMVLTSAILTKDSSILLRDDGQGADAVAGDNVFSAYLPIAVDTAGLIPYSLRARDALGNDTLLVSAVILDNVPPTASLHVEPLPTGGDSLNGIVYVPKIVLKGRFSDGAGSGIAEVTLEVLNDSGQHVMNSPIALPPSPSGFSHILNLVPGGNRVLLIALDKAGNADTARAKFTYEIPKATLVVDGQGGTVRSPNGSGVVIPAGALDRSREITIRPADASEEAKPLNPLVKLLGIPEEFGPDHTVFRKAVTLTLTYTDADLDPNQDGTADIRPEDLTVVFWDGQAWVRAGVASLDKAAHSLTVDVNHFTLYDLAEDKTPPPDKVVAFWNANPIREGQGGVFHYKLPEAGKVSLDILDMSGDLVNALIPAGTDRVAGEWSWDWNGDNVSGRFAGAGLYVYVFRFEPGSGKAKTLIRKPVGLVRK